MTQISIGEAARLTGLSAHTLRYYERIGLIAPIRRRAGRRRDDEADLQWVGFLHQLRATGMPIRQMKEYADLLRRGPETATRRTQMLEGHRDKVVAQIAELSGHLATLERKIDLYRKGELQ